jgi:hypothetical protein
MKYKHQLPINWQEEVRQTLQAHCPSRPQWNGKDDFFVFHRRGHWSLAAIQNEIFIAAKWLIRTYRDQPLKEPPQKIKWETAIGWGLTDDDPIATRLEGAVADAERLCRPYLEADTKII